MSTDQNPVRVVLASSNAGKLQEFARLFAGLGMHLVSQDSLGIQGAEENGLSFIENALFKARHAALESGGPAIGDDSGLSVAALNGAPGIFSSRYAGADSSDLQNNRKLLHDLAAQTNRKAQFYCALAYLKNADDPMPLIATGCWCGEILTTARGLGGFGYDPLFYLPALKKSAAELSPQEKNRISHRAMASRLLLAQLQRQQRAC